MEHEYGIVVSTSLMTRWFHVIGPFKGMIRKTNCFPPAKFSWRNNWLLKRYLRFMSLFSDQSRFVFADKKLMKKIGIYGLVRRDVKIG